MIVTRNWLKEWIDIDDISTQEIVGVLNSIGLEVEGTSKIEIPRGVVVGEVLSCQKHPNADKLNLCEVNVGKQTLQIVCGAKNVQEAKYVAVATVGTVLPGEFEIKPVKLRGVESFGMICSSTELGLPKMEDGIMVLDESIDGLAVGKELRELPVFNDEIIEIELTANRGDCLSILGVARELSTVLNRKLKEISIENESTIQIGIGRLINLEAHKDIEANLLYKAFKSKSFTNPFLVRMRVALTKEEFEDDAQMLAFYVTYSTGVLTRIYGYEFFKVQSKIEVKKDENGFDAVYGRSKASIVGVYQFSESQPTKEEENFIIEASFIDPETISKKMFEKRVKSDWSFYRSSRGTDPRLTLAIEYLIHHFKNFCLDIEIYSGTHELIKEFEKEAIKISFEELDALIGQNIDKNRIVDILKSLQFTIILVTEESIVVKAPIFRHDIENLNDVAEEIVRIYGIEHIKERPLKFKEDNRLNVAYENFLRNKKLRILTISQGYYETISYIFTNKKLLGKYSLEIIEEDLDLLNPITNELNTLRTSLVPNLLEQAINNIKNGQKRVKLFEIGKVFSEKREEKEHFVLLFSGLSESELITNRAKPKEVSFSDVAKDLASILGDIEFQKIEAKNSLMHPYQSAAIFKDKEEIGVVYKLHTALQEELELPSTYIAQIELEKLDVSYPKAKPYSIYQTSFRDLSLLVDRGLSYESIKSLIQKSIPKEIKRFYPIDIYSDEKLGDKVSLTIRFAIQSDEKTLNEEEISSIMEHILSTLKSELGLELR